MFSKLCLKLLNLFGWQIAGEPPTEKKYVAIVAPHTSNWDFFVFVLMKFALKLKVNFIGKHTIFVGPIGWFLKKMGGVPVDRRSKNNVVDQIVETFNQREELIFALSPEGTRSYKDHWKSGFYHIALKANVPLQFCFLDNQSKKLGFGPMINLTGDQAKDLETIKAFYQDKQGIKPKQFSKICFRQRKK